LSDKILIFADSKWQLIQKGEAETSFGFKGFVAFCHVKL